MPTEAGRFIPYGRQSIAAEDIQAVVDVLQSDWLTQGPAVERFEQCVADYCGARYAVAVSSATAGLHLACLAAGLQPGDRLWTVPNTFVASANCARYCGAEVDFVDIHPQTYTIDIDAFSTKLERAEQAGTLPKIVIPVHFAGQACDMDAIAALAQRYGFRVIEDAAHAVGGSYRDAKIGACTQSDMAVFSFHPVKIVTTGEGGMVLTNSQALYAQLVSLRSHGITRAADAFTQPAPGPWYYEQQALGYNYRMTDLQAALGASQMTRIDAFVARRHQLADRYDAALAELPVIVPTRQNDARSALHLYPVQVDTARTTRTRREVFDFLRARGIGVQVHYIPVHWQPYYRALGFAPGDFPVSESYYARAISLPMHYGLSDADQDFVIDTLREALA